MISRQIPWREKTVSAIAARREAACAEQLRQACQRGGVLGQGSSHTWQEAYEHSYMAVENNRTFDLPSIRKSVRNSLFKELPLISIREEMLLQRMMIFGGSVPLLDPDEYSAAISLIRRLWCTIRENKPGFMIITLHNSLGPKIAQIMQSPEYHEKRLQIFTLTATLHSLLYLNGFVFVKSLARKYMQERMSTASSDDGLYLNRFLMTEFDYIWDSQKEMVMLHPGLACPEDVISVMSGLSYQEPHFTHRMMLDGMRELLEEERPAVEALRLELEGALQPEYQAADTVNELKLLVKQGAGMPDLQMILADQMATAFHPGILSALRRLEAETVRWSGVSNGVLN